MLDLNASKFLGKEKLKEIAPSIFTKNSFKRSIKKVYTYSYGKSD